MSLIIIGIIFFIAGTRISGLPPPLCAKETTVTCWKPAYHSFKQSYFTPNKEEITEENLAKQLLRNCELQHKGQDCLKDIYKRCKETPAHTFLKVNTTRVDCQQRLASLTTGCNPGALFWHKACQDPLQFLYSVASLSTEKLLALNRTTLHAKSCCHMDQYNECVKEKSREECNKHGHMTFDGVLAEINIGECDSSVSFKRENLLDL